MLQLWKRYDHEQFAFPSFGSVPMFSLSTEDRRSFTNENFKGKTTIVDFIFTTCAGPCPLMSGHIQELQHTMQNQTNVQFVSFSVDPETDTPEVLAEYAQRFGAIKDRWIFLTGEKKNIYDLIHTGFHLAVDADSNAIAHSTKFVLVDKDAAIRGYYDSEGDSSLTQLIHDVKLLAKE